MRTNTSSAWPQRLGLALAAGYFALCPLLLDRSILDPIEFPRLSLLLGAGLVLAVLGLSSWVWSADGWNFGWLDWRRPDGLLNLGIVLWLLSAVVSTLFSVSPATSFWGVQGSYGGLVTMAGYVVLFAVLRWLMRTKDEARGLLLASLPAAAGVMAYAVVQIVGRDPLIWNDVSGYAYLTRWFSTLGHANHLSAFAVMVLPLVGYGLYRAQSWTVRVTLAALAVGLLVVVAASLSRGAWLALAAVVLLLLPMAWKRWGTRRVLLGSGLAALLLIGAWAATARHPQTSRYHSALKARIGEMSDAGGRRHIWQAAWTMTLESPVLGVGPDAFGLRFGRHRPAGLNRHEWDTLVLNAHNLPLHTLATQGILGLLALGVMTAGLARCGWHAVRHGQQRGLAWAACGGVIAFAVQIQFNYNVIACGGLFVLLAAILARLAVTDSKEATAPARLGWLRGGTIAGAAVGVCLLVDTFLHDRIVSGESRGLAAWSVAGCTLAVLAVVFLLTRPSKPTVTVHQVTRSTIGFGWRPLIQLAVVGCALWLAWFVVLNPYEAARLSHQADGCMAFDPHQADRLFSRAIELTPGQNIHQRRLARAAVRLGLTCNRDEHRRLAFSRAHDVLVQASASVPDDAFVRSELAQAMSLTTTWSPGRAEEALAQFDAALEREPRCSAVLLNACRSALSLKRYDRARDYATRLNTLYPDFGPGVAVLALLDWNAGARVAALERARRAEWLPWRSEMGARCDFNDLVAWMFAHAGEVDEARRRAQEGMQRRPDRFLPHLALARVAELEGNRRAATAGYRLVLELCPGQAEAKQGLTRLQQKNVSHGLNTD